MGSGDRLAELRLVLDAKHAAARHDIGHRVDGGPRRYWWSEAPRRRYRVFILLSLTAKMAIRLFTPSTAMASKVSNAMKTSQGFTLVEVLIAMAITALVSIIAESGLSAAIVPKVFALRPPLT